VQTWARRSWRSPSPLQASSSKPRGAMRLVEATLIEGTFWQLPAGFFWPQGPTAARTLDYAENNAFCTYKWWQWPQRPTAAMTLNFKLCRKQCIHFVHRNGIRGQPVESIQIRLWPRRPVPLHFYMMMRRESATGWALAVHDLNCLSCDTVHVQSCTYREPKEFLCYILIYIYYRYLVFILFCMIRSLGLQAGPHFACFARQEQRRATATEVLSPLVRKGLHNWGNLAWAV
jgi:hypothetical protein